MPYSALLLFCIIMELRWSSATTRKEEKYQPQQALHDPSESTLYDSIWNQLDAYKQRIKEEKSSKAKVEEVVDRVWTLS